MRPGAIAAFGATALILGVAALQSQSGSKAGFQTNAKYPTEADAIRKGEELGLGEASLAGPTEVVAGTDHEFAFRFTVGRAGLKTGGRLVIATAHAVSPEFGGTRLQSTDPKAENYLTFRTSTGSGLEWVPPDRTTPLTSNSKFTRFHPWNYINEFQLTGPPLKAGDSIEIKMGDRSGGSPGVRVQMADETAATFRFYIDAFADNDFLPLARNPHIRVLAAEPSEIHAIVPSEWLTGKPGSLNVWIGDRFGNPAESFRGTVIMDTDAPPGQGAASLPAEYTFRAEDKGAHRFENITLPAAGTFHIRVREKQGSLSAESNPLIVSTSLPGEKIYWGDLHNHTSYSDGRGIPEETYDFGKRISALDFCAVTDHDILLEDWMWRRIEDVTNSFYQPGRYVTFLAYEWSGAEDVGGDHNVYTTESSMPLFRSSWAYNDRNLRMYHGPDVGANHVEDLYRQLSRIYRNENVLTIPHWGGRHGNPAFHNPTLQRAIEIFSSHRRSEDWTAKFLNNRYRLGIIASTDDHMGNAGYGVRRANGAKPEPGELNSFSPPEMGTALVAAYAKELTRDGIFQALYHRRTYATTGQRIVLRFDLNDAPMGSEVRVSAPPKIRASAEGTAAIQVMRLVKDGAIIQAIAPAARSARLEFQDTSGDYDGKFYYVDLVQIDGKKAVSSPIWTQTR